MKRPNNHIMSLHNLGRITSLTVDYIATGVDSAETYVTISGVSGQLKGRWKSYKEFLQVEVTFNSVASLKSKYKGEVLVWMDFQATHKREMDEYNRLKAKYG